MAKEVTVTIQTSTGDTITFTGNKISPDEFTIDVQWNQEDPTHIGEVGFIHELLDGINQYLFDEEIDI